MCTMDLQITKRDVTGKKVKTLRREWLIPAVIYGKWMETISIACNKNEFVKLYRKEGSSTPINLKWDGIEQMVLVHNFQLDPVLDIVTHVDFLAIKKGEKVETEVPVHMIGETAIEKSWDGRIQQLKDFVNIEAIPSKLPKELTIDISKIESKDDVLFVKDIELPSWVEMKDAEDIAIVTVAAISNAEVEEDTGAEENAAGTANEETTEETKWE